jgi:hypothetical protein
MYPDVIDWLRTKLIDRYWGSQVDVRDTHSVVLNQYIVRNGLQGFFDSNIWQTYEIQVDVTAFVRHRGRGSLVFVECKNTDITLQNLSQLLGYSRVALPIHSYLLSSTGIGSAVRTLILTYDRTDVLEYHWQRGQHPRSLVLGEFDRISKQMEMSSVLPRGLNGGRL